MSCELCSLSKKTDKILEVLETVIQSNMGDIPLCFHCGVPYEKDLKYCDDKHYTWKPGCNCLNKPTIRIVTGVFNFDENYEVE